MQKSWHATVILFVNNYNQQYSCEMEKRQMVVKLDILEEEKNTTMDLPTTLSTTVDLENFGVKKLRRAQTSMKL